MKKRHIVSLLCVLFAFIGSIAIHQLGHPTLGALILLATGMAFGYSRGSA